MTDVTPPVTIQGIPSAWLCITASLCRGATRRRRVVSRAVNVSMISNLVLVAMTGNAQRITNRQATSGHGRAPGGDPEGFPWRFP